MAKGQMLFSRVDLLRAIRHARNAETSVSTHTVAQMLRGATVILENDRIEYLGFDEAEIAASHIVDLRGAVNLADIVQSLRDNTDARNADDTTVTATVKRWKKNLEESAKKAGRRVHFPLIVGMAIGKRGRKNQTTIESREQADDITTIMWG